MTNQQSIEERLSGLEAKMDGISSQLQQLIDARKPMADLGAEVGPIAKAMMDTGIEQLDHLEKRGYFAFGREMLYLVDRLVEDYDPADLHSLADSVANILDTVKALTQPPVLALARDLAEVVDAGAPKPIGAFGMWRRMSREKNVQRGLGFALDLLGAVGRGVSRAPRTSRAKGGGLGQHSPAAAPALRAPRPQSPSTAQSASTAGGAQPVPPKTVFVFVADADWSPEYVQRVADARGVGALTEEHWALINFARDDFKTTKAAPNIRRMTLQTKVSTRDIYRLFPKAPGLTISHLAGVPKPVGCL